MLEEITKQLWLASEKKRACRIRMKGEPFPRTVHPYGVCSTSSNRIVLVCRQTLGFTKPGGKEGYRNLVLQDIQEVEMLEFHFPKPTDFNPTDSQYKDWVFHI